MATVSEIIIQRLGRYSIELSPVELAGLLVDAGLNGSASYTDTHIQPVKRVIVDEISRLLAMPDVTEGGYSVKWDRAQVAAYCNQLRGELDGTTQAGPTLTDKSYLW